MTSGVSGTQGYAEAAEELFKRYQSFAFADLHEPVLHLIPQTVSCILDIGSGSGRDAAAFAAMGHRVVAVEPADQLRRDAPALYPSPTINGSPTVCRSCRCCGRGARPLMLSC